MHNIDVPQAALYSGILTSFVIGSMSLLQEDNTDTTRAILLVITQQLANHSIPPFQPEPFTAPDWAVRVNIYFFFSLSLSLVTALAAVLALQWVGSYDRGLSQSSPEDRAVQREFRVQGVEKWRLDQIVGFLPALIFLSLFIFFIGVADWLWHIHHGVAAVIISGAVVGALFFTVTTVISIVDVGAPFRSPLSRSLPVYLRFIYQQLIGLLFLFSPNSVFIALKSVKDKPAQIKEAITKWYQDQKRTIPVNFAYQHWIPFWLEADKRLLWKFVSPDSVEERERDAISAISTIKCSTIIRLARSINIIADQKSSFLILIQALLELPPRQLADKRVNHGAPFLPCYADPTFAGMLSSTLMKN